MSAERPAGGEWWKVCDHPFVRGFHRLVTLIAAPLAVLLLAWGASAFDGMRMAVTELKTIVAVELRTLHETDSQILRRVERLEDRP